MSDPAAFHDVRFPTAVSFGATGGPRRRNEIVALTSGREVRNARSLDDLYDIVAFFEARRGSLHAFRFRDPFDMKSCAPAGTPQPGDQLIGTGDGAATEFPLVKTYGAGADAYRRSITKPVAGTVRVEAGGIELEGGAEFTVDLLTGLVTLTAPPAAGAEVRAGYEFDIAARFDTDELTVSLTAFKAGQIPAIPIVEVRQ